MLCLSIPDHTISYRCQDNILSFLVRFSSLEIVYCNNKQTLLADVRRRSLLVHRRPLTSFAIHLCLFIQTGCLPARTGFGTESQDYILQQITALCHQSGIRQVSYNARTDAVFCCCSVQYIRVPFP